MVLLLAAALGLTSYAQDMGQETPGQEADESGPKPTPPPPYATYEAALEPIAKGSGLTIDQIKQLLDRFCILATDERIKELEARKDDSAAALAEMQKKQRHIMAQQEKQAEHYRNQATLFMNNQAKWETRLAELQKDFDNEPDEAKKQDYLLYWRGLAQGYWMRFYSNLATGERDAILAKAQQWAGAEPEWTQKAVAKTETATRLTYFRRLKQPNGRYKNLMQAGFGMQSDGYEELRRDVNTWNEINNLDRVILVGDAYFKIAALMKMADDWAPKGKTAKDVLEQLCRYEAPQLVVRFKL
jgi:hypothetical protein